MGIYIKELGLPAEDIEPLRIELYADGTIYGIRAQDDFYEMKAIEIQPHGRLIDSDESESI